MLRVRPHLYLQYIHVLSMLQRRGYVTSCNLTEDQFQERFCVYDEQVSTWLVDREKLSISVIHRDRSKHMRVFFIGKDVFGKKDFESVLKRLGDEHVRLILVFPDACRVSPAVKTIADLMNRDETKSAYIQFFTEEQLIVDFADRDAVVLSEEEKKTLFQKYKATKPLFLQRITSDDVLAKYHGMRPGDILRVITASPAAGKYTSYKVCVHLEDAPKETKRIKKN